MNGERKNESFKLLQLSDDSKSLSDLELPEIVNQRKRKVRRLVLRSRDACFLFCSIFRNATGVSRRQERTISNVFFEYRTLQSLSALKVSECPDRFGYSPAPPRSAYGHGVLYRQFSTFFAHISTVYFRKTRTRTNSGRHDDDHHRSAVAGSHIDCKNFGLWLAILMTVMWLFIISYITSVVHSENRRLEIAVQKGE